MAKKLLLRRQYLPKAEHMLTMGNKNYFEVSRQERLESNNCSNSHEENPP
jgi:hypothetical protein